MDLFAEKNYGPTRSYRRSKKLLRTRFGAFIGVIGLILLFLAARKFGSARSQAGEVMIAHTVYTPSPAVHKGPLAPVADDTFLMLKTGAEVAQQKLPIHILTTFKRFPYHATYGDGASRIGDEEVIDIFEKLPSEIFELYDFKVYLKRRESEHLAYNWDPSEIQAEGTWGWISDKYKNVPMILDAYSRAPPHIKWFLIADDDTYILQHSLDYIVRDLDPMNVPYYIGSVSAAEDALTKTAKDAEEKIKETGKAETRFAHGGSGVLMSRELLRQLAKIFNEYPEILDQYLAAPQSTCCGDLAMGFMIQELLDRSVKLNDIPQDLINHDPFQGETLTTTSMSLVNYCKPIASFHHLTPDAIQRVYDWESSLVDKVPNLKQGILFGQLYNDFILPYMVEERSNWDNLASSAVINEASGTVEIDGIRFTGHESAAECKKACSAVKECFAWSYRADEHKCMLDNFRFRLGRSTAEGGINEPQDITSGWNINRIRDLRANMPCDWLESVDGKFNDNEDTHEGWYFAKNNIELKKQD